MLVLPVQIHLSQHSQFGGSGDQSTLAVELIRAEARGNAVNSCVLNRNVMQEQLMETS